MKIHPMGAVLFHTDRQTDRQAGRQAGMTKLIVAVCNFANTPKVDLKETGKDGMDLTNLAQDMDKRKGVSSIKCGEFL
jgi:hypothetical protein